MSDQYPPPPPSMPPPPPGPGPDAPRHLAPEPNLATRSWQRFRGWPAWAQIGTALVLLIIIAGALSGDDDADVAANGPTTTTEEVSDDTEDEEPEVEDSPSTTERATTTTTTTIEFTPEELREGAVLGMSVAFDQSKLDLAEVLNGLPDIESVDRFVFENETVVLDVTSTWATDDNQREGAWTIVKALSILWSPAEGNWYQDEFVPNLNLINSGTDYNCTGEFMVAIANLEAGRADFESTC